MFDISFSELLVIAIVALVVIGPEKLPKVARTAGAFFGKLQRFVAQVKDEVNRESRFAELQKLQEEVHSSLQQSYVDIEHSILSSSEQVATNSVEADAIKKPRKPRQAISKQAMTEKPLSKTRRRTKAAVSESDATPLVGDQDSLGSLVKPTPDVSRKRKSKSKQASNTPDMFVDAPRVPVVDE